MHRSNIRARVAVGAAVLAIAGSGGIAPLSASATTTPPSTEPPSSAPTDESVPELDEEREALVDQIVDASDAEDFPLDRNCIASLMAQVSDADVAVIASQVTEPTDDSTVDTAVIESTPTMESAPALSPEAEALGEQLIYCASGDADPELVAQVMALIEASDVAPEFDLVCTEAVLTTFEDETLQLIIDNGVEHVTEMSEMPDASAAVTAAAPETSAAAPDSVPEAAFEDALILFACTPAFGADVSADSTAGTVAAEPAGTEVVTETTEA